MTSCTQRATTTGAPGGGAGGGPGMSVTSSAIPYVKVCPVPEAVASILFIGDIVGSLGRHTLLDLLPVLRKSHDPTFVVVNGENAAGGLGITPKIADELFGAGVDAITLGNHAYHRREIFSYLDSHDAILRPYNYLRSQPGHGLCVVSNGDLRLGVVNLSGNLFVRAGRPAFTDIDVALGELEGRVDHVLVDFHAEATSEKVALGWYLDGRVSAVVGTHTHVPTADGRVLPGRHGVHHRRRHDGSPRRRHRRAQGAVDPQLRHAHERALRHLRGRPLADGRARALLAADAGRLDRAAAAAGGLAARVARAPTGRAQPSASSNWIPRSPGCGWR